MRIYLGIGAKEDFEILHHLHIMRDDIGACVSAYYYKTKLAIRKNMDQLVEQEIPIFLDNGAVQTFRLGTKDINVDYLRSVCQVLKPEFLLAPDVLGDTQMTIDRQLQFIQKNDDLELLAPLQSHNIGPLFPDKIINDIEILKDAGYRRFGFGRPYATKMTRRESLMNFGVMLRPHTDYLHFLGYPLGQGIAGANHLDSMDVGTYSLMMKYRYQVYKNPEASAKILNGLIEVEQTLKGIREKQAITIGG